MSSALDSRPLDGYPRSGDGRVLVGPAIFKIVGGPLVRATVGSTPIHPRQRHHPSPHYIFAAQLVITGKQQMLELPPKYHAIDVVPDLRAVVSNVMEIADVTAGLQDGNTARFRGQLKIDSADAYKQLSDGFQPLEHTPLLREEDGMHVILAMPSLADRLPPRVWINAVLFGLTVITVLYAGAGMEPDFARSMDPWFIVTHLYAGWPFAVSLLGILLAHELGHYFVARWHGAPVTLPYFIPMPFGFLGTMGAVIRMQAPTRDRRVLMDIGVAGPLAGMAVAVPVLLVGLALSKTNVLPATGFAMEGNSILYLLAKFMMFGRWLPAPDSYGNMPALLHWVIYFFTGQPSPAGATDVLVHPVALAGWAGLLVTGLNLIPAGQLDGGHALFTLVGERAKSVLPYVLVVLALMGVVWEGWWLWAAMIFFLGRQRAPLLDEVTQLDPARRLLATFTLALFFLVITPIPMLIY